MSSNVVKEFLNYLNETQNLSASRLADCEEDLNRLSSFAASRGKAILSLERKDLTSYLKFLRSEAFDTIKISKISALLREFYQFVLEKDYLQHNPANNLSSPKAWQTMPKFLSKEEVDKLFATPDIRSDLGLRDLAMFQLLYVTGLRASELIVIKFTDIDLVKGTLTYLGKSNKERDIDLGKAKKYIETYLPARKSLLGKRNSELLFVNNYGEEITRQQFWKIIVEYGNLAGLGHITPHMLRHTFATHLLEHGADKVSVEMLKNDEGSKKAEVKHVADDNLMSVYQKFNPRARS
jgi:integrase/recombinase XerD